MAADDWRVAETWRGVHGKLVFATAATRNEALILWRRIAGGFTAGQQLTIFQQIAGPLRAVVDPRKRSKGGSGLSPHDLIELLRLVGSLELLPAEEKIQLGNWLVDLRQVKKWAAAQSAMLWTIGRLAARVPSYGPLNNVVSPQHATHWLRSLLAQPLDDSSFDLALMLAARRCHDRHRDVDSAVRAEVLQCLRSRKAAEHYIKLVEEGGALETEEANAIFGDSLPLGLKLTQLPESNNLESAAVSQIGTQ